MPNISAAVSLSVQNLHWLDEGDGAKDLCAHGEVEMTIGEKTLSTQGDSDWCVSAAALYLLRTLTQEHTTEHPVGEHLIPCCGHFMMRAESRDDVMIVGCINGIDWEVLHDPPNVILRTIDGYEAVLPLSEWRAHVVAFADKVEAFYQQSAKKQPSDDFEAEGYTVFLQEWSRRRQQAESQE